MSEAVSASPSKPVVLIADDSKLVRVSLNRTLREEFEVLEAVDGEEAWELLLSNNQIQVLITDAGMPRLDGYELIKRIRSQDEKRLQNIPILMITGAEKAQTEVREKALGMGASDFITKPFDKVQLVARTRSYTKLDTTVRNLDQTSKDLESQSIQDSLTGIHNSRHFLEQTNQALAFAQRHSQALSFLAISVDELGSYKTQHGEESANTLQIMVAQAIKPILRKEDVFARSKEGYFLILAPFINTKDAHSLGARIQHLLHSRQFIDACFGKEVTLSIGIASLEESSLGTAEQFLQVLEQRVKQAHKKGGNTICSGQATPREPVQNLSVDTALKLINQGNVEALEKYLPVLAKQILPLVELCNQKLSWQLDSQLQDIKTKL